MRVTDKMNYEQVTRALQKNRSQMSDLQGQAATQKRVTKPSDDPIAAARVLALRVDERQNAQFIKNIQHARSFLEASETALAEATDVLIRLKELAIQQANDAGASAETRRFAAEEVAQMYSQMIQIGNRKLGERFLFSGAKTTTAPFSKDGEYQGDALELPVQIQKEAFITSNLPGDRVFLGKNLLPDGRVRATEVNRGEGEPGFSPASGSEAKPPEKSTQDPLPLRGLASVVEAKEASFMSPKEDVPVESGVNILQAIKEFEVALRTGDKTLIQEAIDQFDLGISQLNSMRSQLGARLQTLTLSYDSLQKNQLDIKGMASQWEDADLFQLVSDMSKTDTTLKATMETSSRLVQPSLLDFLK
jgi:flagellar hook-associated protein 3 FlgL